MMKNKQQFKYLYGPVSSWRLGRSVGIDLISRKTKQCSFDCTYCQLGRNENVTLTRQVFVPTTAVIAELKSFPAKDFEYYTFSGTGEPTLAKNIGPLIKWLKHNTDKQVAVLTNSTTIMRADVRKALLPADVVVLKFDAGTETVFKHINHPAKGVTFTGIIRGIQIFRKIYRGKLAVQLMFVPENVGEAKIMVNLVKTFHADEVQVNTPLRPSGAMPLPKKVLLNLKKMFGTRAISAYDKIKPRVKPVDTKSALFRRGKRLK
ncbi:MAG: radical SAM protein [Elusimicrobiota bacterium]